MESPWDGGTKVLNGPGHMTKTAAMPKPFKNLLLRFQPKGWWPWNLVCSIGCSSTTKFVQMMTLTYFAARSNLVPYAFIWEIGKTVDFSETIVVYDLKLATDDRSDMKFLLTSKLCSLPAVCPPDLGLYTTHVLNQADLKKNLFTVTRLTQKTCPYPKKFIGHQEEFFFCFCFQC